MVDKKIIYLIKWMKNEKPFYQLGEMVPTGMQNKYIPAPPELFYSLNSVFRYMKNNLIASAVVMFTMGMDQNEIETIDLFIDGNYFIKDCKHLSKPLGKKPDGSPYKVYMVDSDFENLKSIKKIIISEHFEIMGVARDAEKAMAFFEKNYRHIDIVIMEIILPSSNGYDVIEKMLRIKSDLKIIITTMSNDSLDVQKAIELKIHGYIVKPVGREKLVTNIKKVLHSDETHQ
ncbi:MAG: response regulator [Spirochaetes bacterium]|nr:response regulator [Spirochaetota bacterium]